MNRIDLKRLSLAVAMLLSSWTATAEPRLERWSDGVFQQVEVEHGAAAAKRLRTLYDLVLEYRDRPLEEQLRVTNDTLNALPWIADKAKWNQDDYWATPFETLATFGGDCEDIAISKLVLLRLMGVPKANLQLGYVKVKRSGEIHMVLVWVSDDRRRTLVLDNLDKAIKSGPERTDLTAVYLTDADGNVTLITDDGDHRSVKGVVPQTKMAKLEQVKQRMAANQAKYREYNEGRPLFSD
jgi:predicted transglutaminase-like cysteine proteinase